MYKSSLSWLDDWPVGLKLNTELSHALCQCFIAITDIWSCKYICISCCKYIDCDLDVLTRSEEHFPTAVFLLGLSGRLGLTFTLSFCSDILSLLTIHIYISYLATTMAFSRVLVTVGSLWNLFRGEESFSAAFEMFSTNLS